MLWKVSLAAAERETARRITVQPWWIHTRMHPLRVTSVEIILMERTVVHIASLQILIHHGSTAMFLTALLWRINHYIMLCIIVQKEVILAYPFIKMK
jgi:hypothetical protein